jgi:hypothetical protein
MFKLGKSFKSCIDPKKWWLIWGHPVQIILAQSPGTPQLENWWTPNTYSCGNAVICSICWGVTIWLLVWNHGIWWLSIYWKESSQLTNIFQRGWNHQPAMYNVDLLTNQSHCQQCWVWLHYCHDDATVRHLSTKVSYLCRYYITTFDCLMTCNTGGSKRSDSSKQFLLLSHN